LGEPGGIGGGFAAVRSGVALNSGGSLVERTSTDSTSSAARAASASVAVSIFAARLAFADASLLVCEPAACAAVARASARWAAALSAGSTFDALAGWSVEARSAALACGPGAAAAGMPEEGEVELEGAVEDAAGLLPVPADAAAALEED
jgi:hypothetical protein